MTGAAEETAAGRLDLGGGVTLAVGTAEDFAYANANMREADRRECEVFGLRGEPFERWEQAWAVRDGEDVCGIVGFCTFGLESPLSRNRLLAFLSTDDVWRRRVKFVRRSRDVVRAAVGLSRPWVTDFYSLPMSDYAMSVKWQVRTLGFHRVGEEEICGVRHTVLRLRRSEV